MDGKIRCLGLLQNNPVGRGGTNERRWAELIIVGNGYMEFITILSTFAYV